MTVRQQDTSLLDNLTGFDIAERFDAWMQTLPRMSTPGWQTRFKMRRTTCRMLESRLPDTW